jgi:diacylglycerol kinase family enzyme
VNEIVNGLLSAPSEPEGRPDLAVVMIGTGADLARTLSLPPSVEEQIARAGRSPTRVIDAGRTDFLDDDGQPRTRHFVNVAGFGLSGATDRIVNSRRWVRALGPKVAFQLGVAQALLRWRNQPVAIRVDGGAELAVTSKLGAIANGCWFGGGMRIAPDAALDDGLFDVVIVGDVSAATLVRRLPMVYRGEHVTLPEVRVMRGRRVVVRPATLARVPLDLDGESPGYLPATFTVIPRAVRLRA